MNVRVGGECVIECLGRLETVSECWGRRGFILKCRGLLLPTVPTLW